MGRLIDQEKLEAWVKAESWTDEEGHIYLDPDELLGALDSFQQERTWHDPEKKLPEEKQSVWVYHRKGGFTACIFQYGSFYSERKRFTITTHLWTERFVDTPPPTEEEG